MPKISVKTALVAGKYLPLLVLIVCLAASFGYWRYLDQQLNDEFENYFDFRARQAVSLTEYRLQAQEQVLRGVRGLFSVSASVNRKQFYDYVSSLKLEENYPGMQGVGFSLIVPRTEIMRHEDMIRKETGRADYTLHPTGQRDFYTSIIYLEPFFGVNLRAFGFDMYSEPVRRVAMEKARDTGQASLTGKVLLVQETGKHVQAGFLIYLPVYMNGMPHGTVQERRANIIGWVYSPFRMDDLLRGIYGERSVDLDIEIYDGELPSSESMMYGSNWDHLFDKAEMGHIYPVKVIDHNWTLKVDSKSAMKARFNRNQTDMVAFSGVGLSVLLAIMAWMLMNGRRRAETYAEEVTQNLKQESEKNIAFLRNASDGIHILDTQGNAVEVSDSFSTMLGYSRNEMIGMNVQQWDAGLVEAELMSKLQLLFASKERSLFETRHQRKDGSLLDVETSSMAFEVNGKVLLFNATRDVTQRNLAEAELGKWAQIFEHAQWGIVVSSADYQRIGLANPAFCRERGYTYSEILQISTIELFAPEERTRLPERIAIAHEKGHHTFESVHLRKDGSTFPVWIDLTVVTDEHGKLLYHMANVQDITVQKAYEKQLLESEHTLLNILKLSPIAIRIAAENGHQVVFSNQRYAELIRSNYPAGDDPGNYYAHPNDYQEILETINRGDVVMNKVIELAIPGSEAVWALASYLPIKYQGEDAVLGWFYDITERKLMEEEIRQLAFYDSLTSLPNRRLLNDRLSQIMAASRRSGLYGAMMFLDLDNFKLLNDTHGHDVGDLLLIEVAARLKNCVRSMDSVARFGGDEFVVMLSELNSDKLESISQAGHIAEKILASLSEPYLLPINPEGGSGLVTHRCTASIGVAVFTDHEANQDDILKWADAAMYQAKNSGRNQIRFYEEKS